LNKTKRPTHLQTNRSESQAELGQSAQIIPQALGISIRKQAFYLPMRTLPNRHGRSQQTPAFPGQRHQTAATIQWIGRNFDQSAPLQRFQRRSQRGAIHSQQRRYSAHGRRLGPVQRHQQRKLAIGEIERPQGLIEAPRQCPGSPLHMQAEAAIANQECGFK